MSDDGRCPECGCTRVKRDRAPYCGPGGYNIIFCKCQKCGTKWEEED